MSIIHPTNLSFDAYSLAAVNFCLFLVGTTQTSRIFMYQKELTGSSGAAINNMWAIVTGDAKKIEKKAVEVEGQVEEKAKEKAHA